jgi:hypothetical protein
MNKLTRQAIWILGLCLWFALIAPSLAAKPQANTTDQTSDTTTSKKTTKKQTTTKAAPTGAASDSEIASAKSSGKVWVNLDSGIYHKSGRYYGKTKNGKFMTEAEAKAAGYKASQKD